MSGKPAARQGDLTKKGGPIVQGSATVLIGSAGGVACSECPGGMAVGNPVNPSLGAKVLTGADELDFALPGPLPLAWQRVYSSYVNAQHGAACGLLGYGWKLPLELRLRLEPDRAVLFDASGRAITFEEPLLPGQALYSSSEDLWLLRGGGMADGHPGATESTTDPNSSSTRTSTPAELLPWAQQPRWSHVPAVLRADPGCVIAVPGAGGAGAPAWVFLPAGASGEGPAAGHVLHAVIDRFGRSQRYQWGEEGLSRGRIVGVTDGTGRRYVLRYERIVPDATAARRPGRPDESVHARHSLLCPDDGMRLVGVDCTFNPLDPAVVPGAAPRPQSLVGYRYDSAGNLAEVLGADGTVLRRFGYDALHRMTEHQVRQGPQHRYVYEDQTAQGRRQGLAARPGARVAEQHNEEGLSYFFEYSEAPSQAAHPTQSARATQAARGSEDGKDGPAPVTASLPSTSQSSTVVRDSLGRTTAYHFEGEGGLKRLVRLVAPDGAEQGFRYDSAGRRLSATDALGRTTWWRYDGAGRLLGVQGPDGRSTQQHWGAAGSAQDGLLLASQDAAGLRTDFRYDDWGRLVEVATGPAGIGDGSTDRQALITRLEYEQAQEDAASGTVGFPLHTLAWCDQPVAMIDAQGGRSLYAYNACGQLARHTDCSGRSQTWRHGAWGEVVEATDALGQRTQLHHVLQHGALRLVGVQQPGNTGVRYRWGPDGWLAAATHGTHDVLEGTGEPAGTSTTVAYRHDLWGRVVEQVQAGRGVQLRYDVAGRLQELVNENGDVTRFVHDAADRLVQEVGFDGRSQVYGYDAAGQLTHTGDGHGEGHHPGAAARPELGAVVRTRLHYDLGGRLVARVAVRLPAPEPSDTEPHAILQIQRFEHTSAGTLLQARTWEAQLPHGIEPMALSTALSSDSSRPGTATDRPIPLAERWLELETQAVLSLLDRPGDPVHAPLAAALQAQRLQPETRVAMALDAFGRVCGETQTLYRKPQAPHLQAGLSAGEPPVEFEHAITHTLGPLGQRTATQAQGLGTLQWLAYGSGHVHGLLLDGQPLVDWERDALHREVGRTLHLLEGQDNADLTAIVHARQLDPMGRMLHQDWRGLRHGAAMPTTGDANDSDTGPSSAAGRIAPALGPLSTLAQRRYWYDPLGQLVGVQTPGEATRYGYDAWQRLSGLHRAGQGTQEVRQHWALDPAGNRLPAPPEAGVMAPHADRQAWARELRDHLQDPDFDLLRAGDGPGERAGPVTHWPGNRIGWSTPKGDGDGQGTPIRYRYDAFGNRVQALHADGRAQRLHYDALHQLREVWEREGTRGAWQRVACYRYDPFGRRLAKTVVGDSRHSHGAAPGSAATTHAGWDGDRLVHIEGPQGLQHTLYEPDSFVPLLRLERDRAIPTPVQAMFALENQGGESHAAALFAGLPRAQREWLELALTDALGPQGDAPRSRLQAGLPEATGALLSAGLRAVRQQRQDSAQAHATRIRHVLCDHLGTPIALVDANGPQAGLVTWAATYHAWGALREEYDPHGIGQDIRFQGQQFDAETGLHYNRFRYYDPVLGQYVTQDPIGLVGGMNKLIYPLNPISKIDPFGLKEGEGGFLSKIFGWGEKASSIKDAAEAGQLVLDNKKLEKEFGRLEDELLSCISQTPTCSTEKMQAIEKRMEEIRKKILKNTGEITKIMMETPGTSAGGPVHIPGMKP
ncbi:RHS repeat-associated core domain-containing protein [Paracidovorax oryzae]|uniref:RHS repeat-associated core domain-containing protein n=1 Tax=Paracidovorax oryzae TaxID=862720 RepID=UPI000554D6B8|nr:RHS repeat-associated core domain-containing protein [Paracidovorax oryzae]